MAATSERPTTLQKPYSQIGQDLSVAKFFNFKLNGYFVDLGAYDGVKFSNSKALEDELGWHGICVEALPDRFAQLVQSRNKETCKFYQCALDSVSGKEVTFSCDEMLSGITEKIDCYDKVREQAPTVTLKTKTLSEILEDAQAPVMIDFLSLDVEGNEFEVLRGCDLKRWHFRFITLEHNYVEPRRSQMRLYLEGFGYKHWRKNEFDDEYIYLPDDFNMSQLRRSPSQTR